MSSLWYISFIDSKNEKASGLFPIHRHTQERKPDELLLHETKGPVYIGESSF